MIRKTFNSKTAADATDPRYPATSSIGNFDQFTKTNDENESGALPDPFFLQSPIRKGLEGYGAIYDVDPGEIDLSDIKPTDVIHTNNIDTILRRNQHQESEEEFGKPDYRRPIAPLYLPSSDTDLSSLMPALSDEEYDRRNTLEYLRSQPVTNQNHAATKALSLGMNVAPTLTSHAHDACSGTGLLDKNGKMIPCSGCEGRGHTLFDITGHTGFAGLQHHVGSWNAALRAHNFYCTGRECYDGCPIEPHVRHIREARTARGQTVQDHDIKYQTGRYTEVTNYGEALRRILAPIVTEDHWEQTATGIRAHSAHTRLEGSLTHNIRPGDLVSVHGIGHDPGATMLVHSLNTDGTINGFLHSINYTSAKEEIEERRSRSRGVDATGKPGLSLELMMDSPADAFSSSPANQEDKDLRNSLIDQYGKRLSTATGANGRSSSAHITTVDRKPTDLKWTTSMHPDRLSLLTPTLEPAIQTRGYIYQTAPWGDVRDHNGERMVQRTGKPYADSTYSKSVRAVKIYRGSNPWSLSNLHEAFHNMQDATAKEKLYGLLKSMNIRNGVPASRLNADTPDYDHTLNLLPRAQGVETAWVKSTNTLLLPSNQKQVNAERSRSELNETMKRLGVPTEMEVEKPVDSGTGVADSLLSPENEKYLRNAIKSKLNREIKPGEFETFKDVLSSTKSLEKAHEAIDPNAFSFNDNIWDEE